MAYVVEVVEVVEVEESVTGPGGGDTPCALTLQGKVRSERSDLRYHQD